MGNTSDDVARWSEHSGAYRIDTDKRADGIEAHPLEFTGGGGEYFRIWIVNVLLSILTLGFYTPFARRRTARYFYANTYVAASPLEFTAPMRKMLFGFLLFFGIYVAFNIASETGQETTVSLFLLAGAALAPYLWGSALRFRLSATRWKGVRLQFTAPWAEVYKAAWPLFALALVWIATMAVLGWLAPEAMASSGDEAASIGGPPISSLGLGLVVMAMLFSVLCIIRLEYNTKRLMVARAKVGNQAGRWKPKFGDFVRIWVATVGLFLLSVVLVAAVIGVFVGGSIAMLASGGSKGAGAILLLTGAVVGGVLLLLLASGPARAYREARLFQLVWNNVGISHIARFKCGLRVRSYVLLRIKNMLLGLLTLGFYRPFALVSEYRMKTESVTLHVKGGLAQLAGQMVAEQGGVGDAMADAVGFDLVG
jgi:uncharacterized membrane protein YjgN (DUF898 family)